MEESNGKTGANRRPLRLLFVCMGNICRSPAAENVMRHLAEKQGLGHAFEIDSAGTIGLHQGKAPDARMIAAARRRGIPMTGRARRIDAADLERFDLILAMDRENLQGITELARRHGRGTARLAMFCDYCETEAEADEVPDPYYGGPEGFERVLDLLEDGCGGILRQWQDGPSA